MQVLRFALSANLNYEVGSDIAQGRFGRYYKETIYDSSIMDNSLRS